MNRITPSSSRLVLVAGLAALAISVHADTGPASAPKAGAMAHKTAKMAKADQANWVQAAAKHNGSGVRLRYSVPAQLQPGQPAIVQLQFSGITAADASVELRAPDGATLTAADGSAVSRFALPIGEVTTLALRLVPAGDGLQTIDVFTAQAERSSAQSVPLKVGSGTAPQKTMGQAQTTPSGEKVLSLPSLPTK